MDEKKNQEGVMRLPSSTTLTSSYQAADGDEIDLDSSFNDDAERDAVVTELARKLTAKSGFPPDSHQNPFNAETDSSLDPNSDSFRPRAWAEALIHLKSQDPETSITRTAGIAFRNLNVHGFGNPTDYQKSVGNVWLELAGLVRKITRTGAPRKIEILHEFDGLVKSGEMVVVLGPPGSGCSTLLKTIAGETHGIYVAEGSELNYQGISPIKRFSASSARSSTLTWHRNQRQRHEVPI